MQPQDDASDNGLLGPSEGLAMRLEIKGPRQLRRSGAVFLFSPGRVYGQWLQRWLLLDGFMLKCFSSCNSLKPKTTIPLQSAVVEGLFSPEDNMSRSGFGIYSICIRWQPQGGAPPGEAEGDERDWSLLHVGLECEEEAEKWLVAIQTSVSACSTKPPPVSLPASLAPPPFVCLPLLSLLNATQPPTSTAAAAAAQVWTGSGGDTPLQPGSAPMQIYRHPSPWTGSTPRSLRIPVYLKQLIPQIVRDCETLKSDLRYWQQLHCSSLGCLWRSLQGPLRFAAQASVDAPQEFVARLLMSPECLYSPSGSAICSSEQQQQQQQLQHLLLPLYIGNWSIKSICDAPGFQGDLIQARLPPPLLRWFAASAPAPAAAASGDAAAAAPPSAAAAAAHVAAAAASGDAAVEESMGIPHYTAWIVVASPLLLLLLISAVVLPLPAVAVCCCAVAVLLLLLSPVGRESDFELARSGFVDADGTIYIIGSSTEMCLSTASSSVAAAAARTAAAEPKLSLPALLQTAAAAATAALRMVASSCCNFEPQRVAVPSVGWQIARDRGDPGGRCIVTCVVTVSPLQQQQQAGSAGAAVSGDLEETSAASRRLAAAAVSTIVTAELRQSFHLADDRQQEEQQLLLQHFVPLLLLAAMLVSRQTAVSSLIALNFLSHVLLLRRILNPQDRPQAAGGGESRREEWPSSSTATLQETAAAPAATGAVEAEEGEGWAYGSDLRSVVRGGVAVGEQQIRASSLQRLLTTEEGYLFCSQAEAVQLLLQRFTTLGINRGDVVRMLLLSDWDVTTAESRLIDLLRWRGQGLVKQLEARHVSEALAKHWGYVYFHDRLRRPCIVLRACNFPAVEEGTEVTGEGDWRQCLLYLIEEALKSAPVDAEQLTLLVDAASLNPRALPVQALFNLAALLGTCYSQYLGMAIVASCGVQAALLWKTVEPFLSAETRAKVYFLPEDVRTARAFLLQFFEWQYLPAWITQRLTSPGRQDGGLRAAPEVEALTARGPNNASLPAASLH